MGGTYTLLSDYWLPDLIARLRRTLHRRMARRCLRYLKQHHKVLHYNPLTSNKLRSHLADVEEKNRPTVPSDKERIR